MIWNFYSWHFFKCLFFKILEIIINYVNIFISKLELMMPWCYEIEIRVEDDFYIGTKEFCL